MVAEQVLSTQIELVRNASILPRAARDAGEWKHHASPGMAEEVAALSSASADAYPWRSKCHGDSPNCHAEQTRPIADGGTRRATALQGSEAVIKTGEYATDRRYTES